MRVLFVYPNLATQLGWNFGLAALSATLLEAGHETRLINMNEELPPVPTEADCIEIIRSWRPGLIAFSALSLQYPLTLQLARAMRASSDCRNAVSLKAGANKIRETRVRLHRPAA